MSCPEPTAIERTPALMARRANVAVLEIPEHLLNDPTATVVAHLVLRQSPLFVQVAAARERLEHGDTGIGVLGTEGAARAGD